MKKMSKYRFCVTLGVILCMAPLCFMVWLCVDRSPWELLRALLLLGMVAGMTLYSMVAYRPLSPTAVALCLFLGAVLAETYASKISLLCGAYLAGRFLYFALAQTAVERLQSELRGVRRDE